MRTVWILLVLFFAGCVAAVDDTPTPSTAAAPPPGITPPPTFSPLKVEHNFQTDEPKTTPFDIPAGTGPFDIRLVLRGEGAGPTTACAPGADAQIVLRDPDGKAYAETELGSTVVTGTDCSRIEKSGTSLRSGTWNAEFTGSGAFTGLFEITASG